MLDTFKKYIEILEIKQNPQKPTIFSEVVEKRVLEVGIEKSDWDKLKTTFQNYCTRGKTYLESGNYADAIEELTHAYELNPFDKDTLLCLAQAYEGNWTKKRYTSDKKKAIAYAEQTLEVLPSEKKAAKIITTLKNAPFQPWIPYKTWWRIARWSIFIGILGAGLYFYNRNKEAIHQSIHKFLEKPTPVAAAFKLGNVNFEAGSYELTDESKKELDRLADHLKRHKNIKGEIASHTDNSGTPALNEQVSTMRAKIVYEYLLAQHVAPKQISYKGYGDTYPLVPNTTNSNRRKNRRIEFNITQ